jgi:hypothetical protein
MVLVVAIVLLTLLGVTIYFYLTRVFRASHIAPKAVKQDTILLETQNHRGSNQRFYYSHRKRLT